MLKIFCEGITDQIFIADFIEHRFNITFIRSKNQKATTDNKITIKNDKIEIFPLGGCRKIKLDGIKQLFIDNTEMGGKNLILFDADNEGINGNNGFDNCSKMLDSCRSDKNFPIAFDSFLWPNNKNDGIFENLLEKIIPSNLKPIFSCIESHINCLKSLKIDKNELHIPKIKEMINFYLYVLNQPTNAEKQIYKGPIWQLDVQHSEELKALEEFLIRFIEM